jgi:hypothetical protein
VRPTLVSLTLFMAALAVPASALADTDQIPVLSPSGAKTIVVDAHRGRDGNPGTARRPVRTVTAAWQRIPQAQTLVHPIRIVVRPGRS